ncbi:MAG: DR2241 family protein [Chthoniobacterales bacterium]
MSGAGCDARHERFARWLKKVPCRLGQVLVAADGDGFEMRHRDDERRVDLQEIGDAESAAEIARYDDAGRYRPLKTAPNLRHGWRLTLPDAVAVELALDLIYPGRMAVFLTWEEGALVATPLRAALARQSGIYRIAAKISDEEINALIGSFCRSNSGCLRTILWKRDENGSPPSTQLPAEKFDPSHDQYGRNESAVPLLCQEACNLVITAARGVVKSAQRLSDTPQS